MWLLRVSAVAVALGLPAWPQANRPAPPLWAAVTPGPGTSLSVTLTNVSDAPVTAVAIGLRDASGEHLSGQVASLASGQQAVVAVPAPGSEGARVILVRYTAGGQTSSFALAPPAAAPNDSPWVKFLTLLLPTALGSALTLFGVWLSSRYSLQKEQAAARLKWKQFLFEHYDQSYRAFLNTCSGTIDPNVIQQSFNRLDTDAMVPPDVRLAIAGAIDGMRKTPAEARKTRDALLDRMRARLAEPL